MGKNRPELASYHSLPQDGFGLRVPKGWEVLHSEPVPGASHYFIPVGHDDGGFSVYGTTGGGNTADSRLELERQRTECVEVVSRTGTDIDGRPAERLTYSMVETRPRAMTIDERGRRQETGPERRTIYADFVFLEEKGATYVVGYRINTSVRDVYGPTLEQMLLSFAFSR